MRESRRFRSMPPYLFKTIDELKELQDNFIDLGMGNPDLPTPSHIVEKLREEVMDVATHRYPPAKGEKILREAISGWYKRRYGVELDPEREVLPLIGSKEGIVATYLTFLDPQNIAIVPTPTYPVHFNGVLIAGGKLYSLKVEEERGFLPLLSSIPSSVASQAKIIFLCYPNNPTTAVAPPEFLKEAVDFAHRYHILLAHDFTYSEITFDGYKPTSLLQIEGAKEIGIEFHSFSKTYSMAGWRVGFVVGNSKILESIAGIKRYIDFGIFGAIQRAAAYALSASQECVEEIRRIYQKRRDIFIEGIRKTGWEVAPPKATMYVWASLPPQFKGMGSLEFSQLLLKEGGVVSAPGSGFGEGGEGYVRFALVEREEKIAEATRKIVRFLELTKSHSFL